MEELTRILRYYGMGIPEIKFIRGLEKKRIMKDFHLKKDELDDILSFAKNIKNLKLDKNILKKLEIQRVNNIGQLKDLDFLYSLNLNSIEFNKLLKALKKENVFLENKKLF